MESAKCNFVIILENKNDDGEWFQGWGSVRQQHEIDIDREINETTLKNQVQTSIFWLIQQKEIEQTIQY